MATFNVADAKARFSELLQKAMVGEEVIIARDNRPLVRLVPLGADGTRRSPGSAKGRIEMALDFDTTPEDFSDYVSPRDGRHGRPTTARSVSRSRRG